MEINDEKWRQPWKFLSDKWTFCNIQNSLRNSADNFLIVIAIGDDYRFAFFGLVTKLWLKFQGLFY